jgi:hypothetical protein
MAASLG